MTSDLEPLIVKEEISFSRAVISELIRATVSKKASFRFKVKGFSMTPFIKDDDVVTISPLSGASMMLGAPVAFVKDDERKLAIHRVVGKAGSRYLIKGDSCPEADGLIKPASILGYVSKIERSGRNIRFGLGRERIVIAYLSRRNVLRFIFWIWQIIPFRMRQRLKNIYE